MRTYTDPAKFYGPAQGLPIGAGMIVRDCVISTPHPMERRFESGIGLGLILTHECDVDQQNERFFNDFVLVCPIIPLDDFCASTEDEDGAGAWGGILPLIAKNIVYRAMYLPPIPRTAAILEEMEGGGIIYLNHISSTSMEWFGDISQHAVCSLSAIGLRAFDFKLQNHLFREKASNLWLMR